MASETQWLRGLQLQNNVTGRFLLTQCTVQPSPTYIWFVARNFKVAHFKYSPARDSTVRGFSVVEGRHTTGVCLNVGPWVAASCVSCPQASSRTEGSYSGNALASLRYEGAPAREREASTAKLHSHSFVDRDLRSCPWGDLPGCLLSSHGGVQRDESTSTRTRSPSGRAQPLCSFVLDSLPRSPTSHPTETRIRRAGRPLVVPFQRQLPNSLP